MLTTQAGVDAAAERLLADVGLGFPTPQMVTAAAAMFERWVLPDGRVVVADADMITNGRLSPVGERAEEFGFTVRRTDWQQAEGPRCRVIVSPGTFAVRRRDHVRRDRAVERANDAARKRAELVETLRQGDACTVAGNHPVWLPDCRCDVPWCEPVGVSRLHTWSARSRTRMVERLMELDYTPLFANGGVPAMITLTYPGDWLAVCPSPAVARRHIRLLQLRWKRRWGTRLIGVWKREFQDRGAPHYHIETTPPDDPTFAEWLSVTWALIVDAAWCGEWCWQRPATIFTHVGKRLPKTGACCEYGRHVVAGTGIDTVEGSAARTEVRWASTALERVGRGPQRPLTHLRDVADAQRLLVQASARLVEAARREGATWAEVGSALGVSRQAAAAAHGRQVRRAARRRADLQWFPGGLPAQLVERERVRRQVGRRDQRA